MGIVKNFVMVMR